MGHRNTFWFVLIMSMVQISLAQEVAEDSVEVQPRWYQNMDWTNLGVYAQADRQYAPTPAGQQLGIRLGTGLQIKRWNFDAFVTTYEDNYSQIIIFPNHFDMSYLYGGFALGFALLQNRWYQVNLNTAFGKGDILWEHSLTYENYFRDTFNMYHAGVEIEATPIRFIRPHVQVGYRKMSEINIPLLNHQDFTGLCLRFGLKIGVYTKRSLP
jgi:hypothetical protein